MAQAKVGGEAKQQKLPPKGIMIVKLFAIIEEGTQKNAFKPEWADQKKILFRFELIGTSHVFKEGEPAQPFAIRKEFNLSLGKKGTKKSNLLAFLEKWLGDEFNSFVDKEGVFNFNKLLNRAGEAMVTHKQSNGNKLWYPEILEVSPVPAGTKVPPCKNKLIAFNIGEDGVMVGEDPKDGNKKKLMNYDWVDTFNELHESFQKVIKESPEYQEAIKLRNSAGNTTETVEDDLADAPVGEMPVDEEDPF